MHRQHELPATVDFVTDGNARMCARRAERQAKVVNVDHSISLLSDTFCRREQQKQEIYTRARAARFSNVRTKGRRLFAVSMDDYLKRSESCVSKISRRGRRAQQCFSSASATLAALITNGLLMKDVDVGGEGLPKEKKRPKKYAPVVGEVE